MVNKWDMIEKETNTIVSFEKEIRNGLPFAPYALTLFGSSILLFRLIPAVSTNIKVFPLYFQTESTASRVVPISSATRDLSYPKSWEI